MSFSLSEFRDFCASKPEGVRYAWMTFGPVDAFAEHLQTDFPWADNHELHIACVTSMEHPRTYGALTARLDALMGEKK